MVDIKDDLVYKVVFSNPRKDSLYIKGNIKRIIIKNEVCFQMSLFTLKQVFHTNFSLNELNNNIDECLNKYFIQCEIFSNSFVYGFKLTSSGKLLTNKRANKDKPEEVVNHNREKEYLLKEGIVIPPLIDLGIFTPDGKIVKKYYDKFKQINRFLEIVEDVIKDTNKLSIIDFGCGKSYLSFILFYYLRYVKKIDCKMIGLDLKADVIEECNQIKDKYGYNDMEFYVGDIALYKPTMPIDMIISLHACDTATDYALYHAIKLNVKYIFSVPCCQHEINLELKQDKNNLLLKYGILKERYSAILTDTIRASILEYFGYDTTVMEFIDMAHSPKNLLIRSTYTGVKNIASINNVKKLVTDLGIKQTLYELIKNEL